MNKGLYCILLLLIFLASCARQKPEPYQAREYRVVKQHPVVILDPGHGGKNDGTKMLIAPYTKEKTLALQTACKVRDLLEQWGYKVFLTRSTDVFVPLAKRVEFAKKQHGSLFVSLHFNHAPNKLAHGIEIFYYDKSPHMNRSKRLAQSILKSIINKTKAHSRGVQLGDFHVLRENTMPAVLVEGGFFSNVSEAKKLSTPKYLNTLSLAIAKGIDDFIYSEKKTL